MKTDRGLALLRRPFGSHVAGQDATLAELRARREAANVSAARLVALQASLLRLERSVVADQVQARFLAEAARLATDGRYSDPRSLARR